MNREKIAADIDTASQRIRALDMTDLSPQGVAMALALVAGQIVKSNGGVACDFHAVVDAARIKVFES